VFIVTRNAQTAVIDRILQEFSLSRGFPREVLDEANSLASSPGLTDPALEDLRHVPFVTIDNADSKDLDQALFVDVDDVQAPVVHYALADGAYYVRRGTALFDEALRRGASYYLPGHVVPMLPKVLSEGIVSLNPRVERRALVFSITLDAAGEVAHTAIRRGLIRSRDKLTYDGVQAYFDTPDGHPFDAAEYGSSLRGLGTIGRLRIRRAERRGIVQYNRVGVVVVEDGDGWRALPDERNDVERYNEQISLLCNTEGARFLAHGAESEPHVQPVYKVHPAPEDAQLEALAGQIDEIARTHNAPAGFLWDRRRETLAAYVRALPVGGEYDRVRMAIERQAMIAGSPSRFSQERGCHYGVGADAYGRFTAPMREMVGIFTHQETVEKLAGDGRADTELAAQVIEAGNRAKKLQRRVTKGVYKHVLDGLFGSEVVGSDAPVRQGTVLGVDRGRLYVVLDDPPLEVKIYPGDVAGGTDPGPGAAVAVRAVTDPRKGWRLTTVD
jgi:ribonuclease R